MRLVWLLVLIPLHVFSQKEVKTYYDQQKKRIQEVYTTAKEDDQKIVGKYLRYYENGNVMGESQYFF